MNEVETSAERIDPALAAAGWGVVDGSRVRRDFPRNQRPRSESRETIHGPDRPTPKDAHAQIPKTMLKRPVPMASIRFHFI